jgi:hypothetical protein
VLVTEKGKQTLFGSREQVKIRNLLGAFNFNKHGAR